MFTPTSLAQQLFAGQFGFAAEGTKHNKSRALGGVIGFHWNRDLKSSSFLLHRCKSAFGARGSAVGEILGVPGSRGLDERLAFGTEDLYGVFGVFGKLELAAVLDHLGADPLVDEAFKREQAWRLKIGSAVALAYAARLARS